MREYDKVAKKHGVSEGSLYIWRKKFGEQNDLAWLGLYEKTSA